MKSRHHDQRPRDFPDPGVLPPSKSQRKREALAVRSLASRLIQLGSAELRRLPLEAEALQAIYEARQIRSNVARKRQLQYVARLLRQHDTGAIAEAMEGLRQEARQNIARQHRCEAWRDRLVEQGDAALQELMEKRSGLDAQELRQLARRAQQELAAARPPAASRALFRHLFDADCLEPLPPPG